MPRAKLTEEQKERRRQMQEAERARAALRGQLEDLESTYSRIAFFGSPTREFEIGELVRFGAHDNTRIVDVADVDGTRVFYQIYCSGVRSVYGEPTPYADSYWRPWWDLRKADPDELKRDILSYSDDVRLNFYQTDIAGLMHYHYRGVDYDAEYQRPHVWTPEQRVKLIDSIFNNIEIGRVVLIDRGYRAEGPMWEMLDGKQRLATLVMFYEDRFRYRGRLFSELHPRDQSHFGMYPTSMAAAVGLTREQKLRYFLKLNSEGTPQDQEHLDHVRRLHSKAERYETARKSET